MMRRHLPYEISPVPETWQERGWSFRLYMASQEPETRSTDLMALTKQPIRAHVISLIDRAEVTGQGFAMASQFANAPIRFKVWWWTLDLGLHRVAVQSAHGAEEWERLATLGYCRCSRDRGNAV